MRIADPTVIGEGEGELTAVERPVRGRPAAARVRMLRLLEGGTAPTLRAGAPLLGYSPRHGARWGRRYRAGGRAGLLADKPRPGKAPRLTPAALGGLEDGRRAGRIATLTDARHDPAARRGGAYAGLDGAWWQLRTHRITPETGRRRPRPADPAARVAFKAGLRGGA